MTKNIDLIRAGDFYAEVPIPGGGTILSRMIEQGYTQPFELHDTNEGIDLTKTLWTAVDATIKAPGAACDVITLPEGAGLKDYVEVQDIKTKIRARMNILDTHSIIMFMLLCRSDTEKKMRSAASVPEFSEFEMTLIYKGARRACLKCYVGWDKQVRVQTYDEAFERFMANKEVKQL